MNQTNGCPKCGNTGIHACTGEPAREWTNEELEGLKRAFEKVIECEKQVNKFLFQKFRLIDND